MPAVEFDKDKLMSALKAGVDINDCDRKDLNKMMVDYQEELAEEADNLEASVNIAAIGGSYKIGPYDIKCVLGNLVLLSSIGSPLTSGKLKEGDAIPFNDCVEAIYVLCLGKEAAAPVMGIKQRISDLMILKPLVKENPAIADKILDRAEKISMARAEFTQAAIEFWEENFAGHDFEKVINDIMVAITDIVKASDNVNEPKASGRKINNIKKKA